MNTTTTTAAPVWINNNGMVVCKAHAGYYLQTLIEAQPNALTYSTPIETWDRDTTSEATCETCSFSRVLPEPAPVPDAVVAASRSSVLAAIHFYGRARAQADFTVGSQTLSSDEVVSRLQRCTRAYVSVLDRVRANLSETLTARAALEAIDVFTAELVQYGSRRYTGEGPAAVSDVMEAYDALVALKGDAR